MKPEGVTDRALLAQILAAASAANATQAGVLSIGPHEVEIDRVALFVRTIADSSGGSEPQANLVAGTVDITRHREGTDTAIVTGAAATVADDGLIQYSHTFTSANWGVGDYYTVKFEAQGLTSPATTFPPGYVHGLVREVDDLNTDVDAILADTADMQPKLGTPAGADMSADIAAVKSDTAAILVDTGTTLDGKINTIDTNVDSILVDTSTTIPAQITALNDVSTAQVNTEVDSALNTAVPTPPTAAALTDILHKNGSFTFDNTTDSLEAIADSVSGLNDPTTAQIADAVMDEPGAGHTTNSTLGAIVNDWEDGGRLDAILDAILADTTVIGATGAGLTSLASAANLTTVDTVVDAIKAKTDNLPAAIINASEGSTSCNTTPTVVADFTPANTYARVLDIQILCPASIPGSLTVSIRLSGLFTVWSLNVGTPAANKLFTLSPGPYSTTINSLSIPSVVDSQFEVLCKWSTSSGNITCSTFYEDLG